MQKKHGFTKIYCVINFIQHSDLSLLFIRKILMGPAVYKFTRQFDMDAHNNCICSKYVFRDSNSNRSLDNSSYINSFISSKHNFLNFWNYTCNEKNHFNRMGIESYINSNLYFSSFIGIFEQLFFTKICKLNPFKCVLKIYFSIHNRCWILDMGIINIKL